MESFKHKALKSFFWSFVETFGSQGIQFAIGVVMARLLLPDDYGLVGVLSVFIGISGVLIDSGFKTSIVRSDDLTDKDCSTIFYVNLVISFCISCLLYLSADPLANYFHRGELRNIVRVFAVIPFINGFGLVQGALILKNLQFKLNAKILLAANLISGVVSIYMAFTGFAYWALVWKAVIMAGIYNILIWVFSSWKPQRYFSLAILKKHFRFSSKLLLTGLIDTFFDNIYAFIFGKYFSMRDLGYFTRGKGYADLVTTSISAAVQKVITPLLTHNNSSHDFLFSSYTKILRSSTLLVFSANALLLAVAEPFILLLLGEKWLPSVPYLQVLSVSGMIYSVLNANSSFLEVKGRSDLILKKTLLSRPVQIVVLLITINFPSIVVACGIVVHYLIALIISFVIISLVAHKKFLDLFKPLLLPLLISGTMGLIVLLTGVFLQQRFSATLVIAIQFAEAFVLIVVLLRVFKLEEFFLLKKISARLSFR